MRKSEPGEKKSFEDMIMYVDENGNLTPVKPDPANRRKINREDIEIGVPRKEAQEREIIRRGVVKFFNEDKGYGFIIDHATNESIFVHANGLIDQINERDRVTFEVESGPKGPHAVAVQVVK